MCLGSALITSEARKPHTYWFKKGSSVFGFISLTLLSLMSLSEIQSPFSYCFNVFKPNISLCDTLSHVRLSFHLLLAPYIQ